MVVLVQRFASEVSACGVMSLSAWTLIINLGVAVRLMKARVTLNVKKQVILNQYVYELCLRS